MRVEIDPGWEKVLRPLFKTASFKNLVQFLKKEYAENVCYPPGELIFEAFNACPLEQLKLVIIGQDPYHGLGQAHGLSFSVADGVSPPPSLINIFKELVRNVQIPYPKSGDLSPWAKQGVLLLNATLTVQAHRAGSHQGKGWEKFTDQVIKLLSDRYQNIVFLLWGGYAKQKLKLIDETKHYILTSGHPSPLSANRGYWFGNKHFSKTNAYLIKIGKEPIDWGL